MFQKRHYEAIAKVLNELQLDGNPRRDRELTKQVAVALARMFKLDNPHFRWGTFLEACDLLAEVQ